jgi:hypothetical protein
MRICIAAPHGNVGPAILAQLRETIALGDAGGPP